MPTDSVLICECLNGPYAGHIVRVAAGRRRFQVRPWFGEYPLEWYELVDVGGALDLQHAPNIGEVVNFCLVCSMAHSPEPRASIREL